MYSTNEAVEISHEAEEYANIGDGLMFADKKTFQAPVCELRSWLATSCSFSQ
ncbi:Protein of unknown function, partial [Gryllus bimaculatus]